MHLGNKKYVQKLRPIISRKQVASRPISKSEHIELYLEEKVYEVTRCIAF